MSFLERVAGSTDQAENSLGQKLSNRELMLWTVGMLFTARELFALRDSNGLFAVDAISLIAWGCALMLIWRDQESSPVGPLKAVVFLACGGISLVFLGQGVDILLIANAIGLFLIVDRSSTFDERRCGMVLCAIAAQGIWAKLFVHLFAGLILRIDAAFVGLIMSVAMPGTIVSGNIVAVPGSSPIVVAMGCSSFAQLSLIFLCLVSLCAMEKPPLSKGRIALVIATLIALVILINTARMALMASSHLNYVFWHEGLGATLYGLVVSFVTVALCTAGAQWAYARK